MRFHKHTPFKCQGRTVDLLRQVRGGLEVRALASKREVAGLTPQGENDFDMPLSKALNNSNVYSPLFS